MKIIDDFLEARQIFGITAPNLSGPFDIKANVCRGNRVLDRTHEAQWNALRPFAQDRKPVCPKNSRERAAPLRFKVLASLRIASKII
jgi:hypothetical protein